MRYPAFLFILSFLGILFFLPFACAEQTGSINLTSVNTTYVTGLSGNTIAYCNSTSDCKDSIYYRCLLDYDGESVSGSAGWCASASQSSCAHNNAVSASYQNISSGSSFCTNTTAYRSCSSGSWSVNETACSSNQVCTDGVCATSSSLESTSSGSSTFFNASTASFIRIVYYPKSFNITQGKNLTWTVIIANGNTTQRNLSVALTGLPASLYSIIPSRVDNVTARTNVSFTLSFSIPSDAIVNVYTVTIRASTSNSSVNHSVSFSLKVLPSNFTLEQTIKPSLASYLVNISVLESRFEESKSYLPIDQQKKIQNLIKYTRIQLDEAKTLLDSGKYIEFNAKAVEIQELFEEINSALEEQASPSKPPADDQFVLLLAVIITIAAASIAFIIWPRKDAGYSKEKGYLPSGNGKKRTNTLKKLFRKRKNEESYFNESKKRRS